MQGFGGRFQLSEATEQLLEQEDAQLTQVLSDPNIVEFLRISPSEKLLCL